MPSTTPRAMNFFCPDATIDAPVLAISCLGRLGRFGNQLFQYSFIRIVADANGYRVLCPPWLGARVFGLSDGEPFAALPLVADRVVLSHAGWRSWAAAREPMKTLIREAGGADSLSGRKLRASFPQVWGDALREPTECAALRGGNVDLWGWFQFHTSVWAPHAERWRELYTPVPQLEPVLSALLRRLLQCDSEEAPPRLIVVHLRAGRGGAPPVKEDADTNTHAKDWGWSEWRDRNTFWPAPIDWYVGWLNAQLIREGWASSRLLVCTDDEASAAALHDAMKQRIRVVSWEAVKVTPEMAALRRVWAALSKEEAVVEEDHELSLFMDWWVMTQADLLATSNSTFSVSAAMLSKSSEGGESRFWRPVPSEGALVAFDPWDCQPLLSCTDEEAAALYSGRTAYE